MTNFLKKVAVAGSTLAMVASMVLVAAPASAATAGGVYKTSDGTVWFVTSDMQKRPFTSSGAFLSYGFLSFSQVMDADASVTALPTGSFIAPADGKIFCATETKGSDVKGECALVTGGMKAAFTSSAVFTGQGYSFDRAMYGDSSFLTKTSNIDNASAAHLAGTLVNNGGTVQMVVSGGLWGIPSESVFNTWGYSFADVVPANAADMAKSQIGVIPARTAGQLVPTGTTDPTPTANCDNLDGTTGSISTTAKSDYSAEEVGEGESEVPVMAFEIDADNDSDIAVTSVKVEFDENESGSEDLSDYASEVTILMGGDVVGSADVDDFTETSTDGTWTKTISLDCAAVAADDTAEFTIAIDGNSTIDSADLSQNWMVDVISVRFEDADGVTTTENTDADTGSFPDLQKTFSWESFATAADVELEASLNDSDSAINDSHIIDVDDTTDTDDEEILSFTLEATGDSDINVTEIPVNVDVTGAANVDDMITGIALWMDGDEIATASVGSAVGTDETYTFDDLDIDINAGETAEFKVAVNLKSTADVDLDNGDTISAQLSATEVDAIDAEDEEGDALIAADLVGTAVGEAHAVYDSGIMLEFVDSSATRTFVADDAGEFDQGEFKITFDVTAFGADMRIDKSSVEAQVDAAGQGVEYTITNAGSNATTSNLSSSTSDTEDNGNVFEVDEDTTRTFTITVTATSSADHYAELSLTSVNWGTATNDTNANYFTFNLDEYKTSSIFLNTF